MIDIIIPVFNEEKNVKNIFNEVLAEEKNVGDKLRIIFVDDGSSDKTLDEIKSINNKQQVSYISFSKNFGKEAAIYAGLNKSTSEYAVVMDSDMQDPPALLSDMYKAITNEGYDAVGTYRKNRKGEGLIRSFLSNAFYGIMRAMTKIDIPSGCRDYVMMKKEVKDAILSLKEKNRFFKGIFCVVGFKKKWIGFDNVERFAGDTKWSLFALFKYSLEAITSFSEVPLVISSVVGVICCFLAFIFMIIVIVRALLFGDRVLGWPSLITIILFLFGLQFLFIGFIGAYLSKEYREIKERPLYIIREEV